MRKNKYASGRWKDAFAFSRRERRGVAVLLIIIFSECVVLWWLHHRPPGDVPPSAEMQEFIQVAESFYAEQSGTGTENGKKMAVSRSRSQSQSQSQSQSGIQFHSPPVLFPFDPNTLYSTGWHRLGLDKKITARILKYRERGGRFRKPEDLEKIYGLPPQQYSRLAPYIVLPAAPARVVTEPRPARIFTPVDIGIADTLELLRIRGVGPAFARRIHSYRERLGGFTSTLQLREIYGMNDSLLEIIRPQVTLNDSANIRKIDINRADVDELRRHPYIGWALAKLFVNYRRQHGPFRSVDELQKIPLVTAELCRKLAPYLSME